MTAQTVTITNDPEYDKFVRVERRRWRIDFADGRRKFTRTRREAQEWCAEMGYTVLPVRQNHVDRCYCGCKYWRVGRCVDCGGTQVEPTE